MRIINKTKKTVLAERITEATTIKQKILGLTISHTPFAIYFHTRFGIHTFGMKYAIDVLILDHTNRAVKIKENLKPNRIFFWNPTYYMVIELPRGTIRKTKTENGDTLSMSS